MGRSTVKPRSPTFADDEEKEEELSMDVMICVVDAAGFTVETDCVADAAGFTVETDCVADAAGLAVEIDSVSAIADAAAELVRGQNV